MLFEHGHGGDDILEWCDRDGQRALHYAAQVGNVQVGLKQQDNQYSRDLLKSIKVRDTYHVQRVVILPSGYDFLSLHFF